MDHDSTDNPESTDQAPRKPRRGSQPDMPPQDPAQDLAKDMGSADVDPATAEPDGAKPRFFLASEGKNGHEPGLEHELQSEAEALVESLKTGRSFYVVYQYRATADCSGRAPQIRKEAV